MPSTRRTSAVAAVTVLLLGVGGTIAAHAQSEATSFQATASAEGVRVGVAAPNFVVVDQLVDVGVPVAQFAAAKTLGSMNAVVDKLLSDQPMPDKPGTYVDLIAPQDPDDAADVNYGKQIASQDANRLESLRQRQVANWWMDLILKENLSIREHMTLLWSLGRVCQRGL